MGRAIAKAEDRGCCGLRYPCLRTHRKHRDVCATRCVRRHAPFPCKIERMAKTYRIALLPGDGIGKEVVPQAVRVLEAAAGGFALDFESFDWGCEYYLRTGRMMPTD